MIGTIVGLILGALLYALTSIGAFNVDAQFIGYLLASVGLVSLFALALILPLTWPVLLQAEQYLTPRISELSFKDGYLRLTGIILLLFPLISIAFAFETLFLNILSKRVFLSLWIVLLGVELDAIYRYFKQISRYLNPFAAVKLFTREAEKSIQNDRELDMCDWIDALSDVCNKAVERDHVALCNEGLNELVKVIRVFFDASTSIAHAVVEGQAKEKGISDRVSYSLFFLLHRYEMINDHAAAKRIEPICSHLVTNTGKICLAAAVCDISLTPHALQFFGRFALANTRQKITEAGPKATCVLLGVAKSLLNDIDVRYLELKSTFFSLIDQIKMIAQEMFKQDKSINIKILVQPFHDLKAMFATEKMANHPDTSEIVHQIDRVLQEFAALEAVLKTMPSLPKVAGVSEAEKLAKQ